MAVWNFKEPLNGTDLDKLDELMRVLGMYEEWTKSDFRKKLGSEPIETVTVKKSNIEYLSRKSGVPIEELEVLLLDAIAAGRELYMRVDWK